MSLYPLKFHPIFKEKLWGGQKIRTVLGKDFGDHANCGETWELSGVNGNISIISNGSLAGSSLIEIIHEYKEDLLGKSILEHFGEEFPLLIKFIDAAEDLSIQVHPDDTLAKKKHGGFGKTEMWYIMQADHEATLISGFNKETNKEEYLKYFNNGTLIDLLNVEKVTAGDVFYLPAGRVHTIGKGLLLAEIQQTSDITYRIYDFDRVDKDGKKRALHLEDALEAMDFHHYSDYKTQYTEVPNQSNKIIQTPFFTTNKLSLDKKVQMNHETLDCFKIYIAVGGSGTIANESIRFGEVLLVPANRKQYTIEPDGELELLETYVEH